MRLRKVNVAGAPFRIGDIIVVKKSPLKDETFRSEFIGREGTVQYFEYDCGCGQSYPNDPMIGVRFSEIEFEEFWKEEIVKRS